MPIGYSPFQNAGADARRDAEGCECEGDGSICTAGMAFVCADGRWTTAEDGPCLTASENPTCEGGTAHTRAADCLAAHGTCFHAQGGYFCGVD